MNACWHALLLLFLATADAAVVTGRVSMGLRDPVQCDLPYTADETIQGYPIAAADGATFGSLYDGVKPSTCGSLIDVGGVVHILVDRIWENDGAGGFVYDNKNDADRKQNPVRAGYQQYDTAQYTWRARGGNADMVVTAASVGAAPTPAPAFQFQFPSFDVPQAPLAPMLPLLDPLSFQLPLTWPRRSGNVDGL